MDRLLHIIKRLIPVKIFNKLSPAYHFLLAWFSSVVNRQPSEKLIVIGVTGTTGKTTSVFLIAKMLEAAGHKVGYTSTAMFSDGEREWLNDKKMTMAGRFFTQEILHKMVKNGCRYAIVETTSEGVRQFRHRFINYDIIVFTGLYPEHIESHGSFEKYRAAKGQLFAHLKKCKIKFTDDKGKVILGVSNLKKIELNRVKKTTILNLDDDQADYFADFWAEEKIGYFREGRSMKDKIRSLANKTVEYSKVESVAEGIKFGVEGTTLNLKLLGEFNSANAMNAICLGLARGIAFKTIKKGLEGITGIPGRLEIIDEGQDFTVIVDYAFEPNALTKLYETIKDFPHGSVIHLLGSTGGGRDIARRPALGQIAGKRAQAVIVTDEDPYDENPEIIIDQVALGAEKAGKKNGENLFLILDRRTAINKALSLARAGDLVLITGKGSEQAICVADGKKIPWDDRQVVREELHKIIKQ